MVSQNTNYSDFQTDRVWFPENLYASWIGLSILLLTTSILFFHMSNRISTTRLARRISMFISVFLLLTAIGLSIGSIVHYYQRIQDIKDIDNTRDREHAYLLFYVTIGGIITFLQVIVLIFISSHKKLNVNT